MSLNKLAASFLCVLTFPGAAASQETQVLWGDTHLHTSDSFDVILFGTPNSTPDTAIRFAKGLPVISPTTQTPWQLSRPLDFVVVSDHAEAMGSMNRLFADDPEFTETKTGKVILEMAPDRTDEQLILVYGMLAETGSGGENEYGLTPEDIYNDLHAGEKRRSTWESQIATVDGHNEPGKFTTFIGWEWSAQPNAGNLHRVIFTPQGGDVASQFLPFSQLESEDPEMLWQWLEETSQATDAQFIAIPHNPNISAGQMFKTTTQSGEPITAEYAETRMKWEPVVEITQIKGDSETHPVLSPDDAFADFETYQFILVPGGGEADPTEADYVRSGLKTGLELGAATGGNPFKMGVIGSTDSHTGMTSVEENHFGGKGQHDAFPSLRSHETGIGDSKGWDMGAAGFAAVWATENTRQSIFDAFQRKEIYGSTGPRISLRFFGGFDFLDEDAQSAELASVGYSKGVPMGGELVGANDRAPTFLIAALKDPMRGNLDRIQIVKGWLDDKGSSQEKVFDVALSDGRTDGSVLVGNTVNETTGEYTNDIGDVELRSVWTDPEFDSTQNAFYYVRVLEIPTPRYSLYDAIALGIDPKETGHPAAIQERAYSSAIWYSSE